MLKDFISNAAGEVSSTMLTLTSTSKGFKGVFPYQIKGFNLTEAVLVLRTV